MELKKDTEQQNKLEAAGVLTKAGSAYLSTM